MDIDTLFDRAVAIVQSLPKSGPIQTDYEDKLGMYSLYKQGYLPASRLPQHSITLSLQQPSEMSPLHDPRYGTCSVEQNGAAAQLTSPAH